MKKTFLGNTGMEISRVTYGGIVSMDDGQDLSDRYVSYAIAHGVNYFDVAPSYGDAEEKLGNSLIPYRKDIFLACKTGERGAEGAARELERSLTLLHTDHFDNYQMHGLSSVEEVERAFSKGGCMEVMLRAKEQGITKNLGVTCHSEDAALRALELYPFDTVLFPTNWLQNMEKGMGDRLAAAKKERGFGFLGMKSMIHRAWNDDAERAASRFPKSWCMPISGDTPFMLAAIRYAFTLGVDTIVPPGNFESFSFAVEHIDEILDTPVSDDEKRLLEENRVAVNGRLFF